MLDHGTTHSAERLAEGPVRHGRRSRPADAHLVHTDRRSKP